MPFADENDDRFIFQRNIFGLAKDVEGSYTKSVSKFNLRYV